MRFSSVRTKSSDEPLTTSTADIILQLGDARIPLKAEKLLGTISTTPRHLSFSSNSIRRTSSYDSGLSAEAQALAAVTRMLDGASSFSDSLEQIPRQENGKERYWSPDDIPHAAKNVFTRGDESVREDSQQMQSWLGSPDSSSAKQQQQHMMTSERDFATTTTAAAAVGKEVQLDEQKSRSGSGSTQVRDDIRRSQTLTARDSKRPRKLDLGHFFTQTQHSKHSASSSMSVSKSSPSAVIDAEAVMAAAPGSVGGSHRGTLTLRPSKVKKELEGDIFDPKTTKRHPPKGIQNWFDAYISSDEEEDDEEGEEEGGDGSVEHERHELPADEIRRTEYHPPIRMQTTRSNSSNLTSSGSEYSGDRPCGHNPRRHHATSSKQDSVVSLTSSSSSGSDNHFHHNHQHQRDKSFRTTSSIPESIHSPLYFTTRHWGPVPRPRNLRSQSHESLSGHQAHYGNIENKPLPLPPNELAASPVPMRYRSSSFYQYQHQQHRDAHDHGDRDRDRDRGQFHLPNTSISSSHLPHNSISSSHHDPLSPAFPPPPHSSHPPPSRHHHLMHVTSEELALLSHLRQSHSRGLSFAEAYSTLARHHNQPQPHQPNLLPRRESHETFHTTTTTPSISPTWERHHTTPSERRHPGRSWTVSIAAAGAPLPRLTTAEQAYEHEAWLRRQFSTIRKTDVDCGEKIERFLKCQQQQQRSMDSVEGREREKMPVELEGSVPGEGHLVGMQMRVLEKEKKKGNKEEKGAVAVGGVLPDDYDCDYDDDGDGDDEQVDPLEGVKPATQHPRSHQFLHSTVGNNAREPLFKLSYTDNRGFGRSGTSGEVGCAEEEETEQEAFDRATRNGSIISFLSRQDSTKHLAHLRPENLRGGGGLMKGQGSEGKEGREQRLEPQPLCLSKGGQVIRAA